MNVGIKLAIDGLTTELNVKPETDLDIWEIDSKTPLTEECGWLYFSFIAMMNQSEMWVGYLCLNSMTAKIDCKLYTILSLRK